MMRRILNRHAKKECQYQENRTDDVFRQYDFFV